MSSISMELNQKITTAREILEAISDQRSQELLNIIAVGESDLVAGGSCMTRKQYYLRLARFAKLDLIKRVEGRYILTTFGKVIYEAQLRIAVAVSNRWKLKAFDALYSDDTIPVSERSEVMSQIINDSRSNEIVLKSFTYKNNKPSLIEV
jgi:hypothetical protein